MPLVLFIFHQQITIATCNNQVLLFNLNFVWQQPMLYSIYNSLLSDLYPVCRINLDLVKKRVVLIRPSTYESKYMEDQMPRRPAMCRPLPYPCGLKLRLKLKEKINKSNFFYRHHAWVSIKCQLLSIYLTILCNRQHCKVKKWIRIHRNSLNHFFFFA